MTDLQAYVQQRLQALDALAGSATDVDRAFYTRARAEYMGYLDAPAPAEPRNAQEDLTQRILRLARRAHQLEREAQDATLGRHWQAWAAEEADFLQRRLQLLHDQFIKSFPDASPPQYEANPQEEACRQAMEELEVREEELQTLIALRESFRARRGGHQLPDEAAVTLHQELEEVRQQRQRLNTTPSEV